MRLSGLCVGLFMTVSTAALADFNWGGDCSQGDGQFDQQIARQASVIIGEIPINKQNVYIELLSDEDVDIQLFDKQTGQALIAWPLGLLSGPWSDSLDYQGLEYEYSGYNGVGGDYGHEYIRINGVTNRVLVMRAYGYQAGNAEVRYSFEAVNTCNEKGKGAFSRFLPTGDVTEIGKIIAGVVNVDIYLRSNRDLDIQLFDGDIAIVKWPDGQLRGPDVQSLVYEDMRIEWSGYEGIDGNYGHEYIKIRGVITKELTMKAYAFQYGTAEVTYEWGVGAGVLCGTPSTSECLPGWECKEGDDGDLASSIPGQCHGKKWCESDLSAEDDCENVLHLAVPGKWICEEFTCVWDTRIVCPIIIPPLPETCPTGWQPIEDTNQCVTYVCPTKQCVKDSDCLGQGQFCKKDFGNCDGKGTCTMPLHASCPPPDPNLDYGVLCTCSGQTIVDYCAPESYLNIAHEGVCQMECGSGASDAEPLEPSDVQPETTDDQTSGASDVQPETIDDQTTGASDVQPETTDDQTSGASDAEPLETSDVVI